MNRQLKNKLQVNTIKNQAGVLIIEAMIAILIFSFGLLGLVGLQALSIQNATNTEERIHASMLVNDLVSTMWINKSINPTSEVTAWKNAIPNELPNGVGAVTINGKEATISVTWKSTSKKSNDNSSKYETTVAMP